MMEERKAPMSRSYPHTEPRGELTVYKDIPCMHKHTQTNIRMSVEASFYCFFPPHNTARTEHILLQTTVCRVCLPLQHDTERDEREWDRKRRREERCSKSQEGGIHVDVGEIHHPLSLAFYYRGEAGPPQSLPHHRKYGGEMNVCVGRNAW